MTPTFGMDKAVHDWVANQLGYPGFSGGVTNAIGSVLNGQLIGGVVFHNYYPENGVIEMSAASTDSRWLSRRMLRAIFTYAIDLLECQTVVMRVSADNSRMLNIAKAFGFNLYTIPRLRGRMEDETVCVYTDDQWRASRFNRNKAHG
jgi:RimJ/RimL family protein N-acetyltransferase